uniref:Macro domain-containing protein n=1 Tax=Takifugu rubripes TaxID=31033 RepID=H2SHM6_TAKRU
SFMNFRNIFYHVYLIVSRKMTFTYFSAPSSYRSVMPIKKPAPVSEKRFEALVSGVKVSVHKADLSNFPVDAVVNAANEGLQHVGGIALALSKAGGPQIQEDSDEHVRKFGVLKTGEAIALPARLLPCKVIIHAVGPKISRHSPPNFQECHLKSVALPAISSGLFGYPLPQCADSIVRSVRWFCEKSQVKYLKEILLVNIDDRTVTEMEKACKRIFSTHSLFAGICEIFFFLLKIKSVENPTLRMIFGLKKNQMKSFTTRRMLQRIPAHFCDMVSHIGFQAEFAPPDGNAWQPAQGQGIYFTGKVSTAMNIWSQAVSEYIYFVEADVLTGKSAPGKPDLILPPPVDVDPLVRYDSLSGGGDISVIFTGYQALPLHIITCKKT